MQLSEATKAILNQVEMVVNQIKDEDYTKPVDVFNNSTIGQHVRHTLEFFECLMAGYEKGIVSYDKRNHDKSIEVDRTLALLTLQKAKSFMAMCNMNKPLQLEVDYNVEGQDEIVVSSNMAREVIYNIEHAIHHMAIIKIGLQVLCPYVELPFGFGVAISTLRYRKDVKA